MRELDGETNTVLLRYVEDTLSSEQDHWVTRLGNIKVIGLENF